MLEMLPLKVSVHVLSPHLKKKWSPCPRMCRAKAAARVFFGVLVVSPSLASLPVLLLI